MRVIVAGSRGFNNRQLAFFTLDALYAKYPEQWEVVSGTARGADLIGEEWARLRQIDIKRMPAKWDQYGRSAGYRRNVEMAEYATHCLVFWDGVSRGTKHMIDIAREHSLPVKIIKF